MGILAVTLINTVQKDQFLNIQIFFWGIPTKNFQKVGKWRNMNKNRGVDYSKHSRGKGYVLYSYIVVTSKIECFSSFGIPQ